MTDTAPDARGGFPEIRPVDDAPPELGRFVAALHRLQDLTVSTNPGIPRGPTAALTSRTLARYWTAIRSRKPWRRPAESSNLPGLGHPLLPPWTLTDSGADGVAMEGHFTDPTWAETTPCTAGSSRCSTTGYSAWWLSTAGVRPTRTAYLHVDYRNITPIDEPLTAQGRISEVDGRKIFVAASMTAAMAHCSAKPTA